MADSRVATEKTSVWWRRLTTPLSGEQEATATVIALLAFGSIAPVELAEGRAPPGLAVISLALGVVYGLVLLWRRFGRRR